MFSKYSSFKRFKQYKKWNSFFDKKCIEFPMAILITSFMVILLYFFDFYSNFQDFEEGIKNICLSISSSLIGLIGILLAGMAFVASILTEDKRSIINKVSGPKALENILVSFEFLAFIIGIQVFEFFVFYLALHSSKRIVSIYIFYAILSISIYFFSFTIFYTISLVGNCVKLHSIVNSIDSIINNKKNLISMANEVRIDFIFKLILDSPNREKFIEALVTYVDNSSIKEKNELKKYFKDYYS